MRAFAGTYLSEPMNSDALKIAVVILCWNGKNFLKKFLPPLLQTTYSHAEFYVADNASTDGSAEYVRKNFPQIKLIELKENKGFAGGYNDALKEISADIYVLLNQDVEVTPGWIEPIAELFENNQALASVQPKIKAYNDKSCFEYAGAAGGYIDNLGYPFCRGRIFDTIEKDEEQYDDNAEIFWATGAAMFVRAEVYHALGGLDADFFAHMEEIDLCWRIKNAGYSIQYCPASTVYHVGGGSLPYGNPKKTFLNYRNNLVMMMKNYYGASAKWNILLRFLLDIVSAYRLLFQGKAKDFEAIFNAHLEFMFGFSKLLTKRFETKNLVKKISAENGLTPNEKGIYQKSIVADYFFRKKKKFSELDFTIHHSR